MADDIVTVYGILRQENRIWMQRRAGPGFGSGFYSLIGGHVEGGESLIAALRREVAEEAGLCLNGAQIRPVCFLHRAAAGRVYLNAFFDITDWTGTPRIMEPDKADHMAAFAPDAGPAPMLDYIRHALDLIARGVMYDEIGFTITNEQEREQHVVER